jgi:hypothetical protein
MSVAFGCDQLARTCGPNCLQDYVSVLQEWEFPIKQAAQTATFLFLPIKVTIEIRRWNYIIPVASTTTLLTYGRPPP